VDQELTDKECLNYGHTYIVITNDSKYLKYVKRSLNSDCISLSSHNTHYQDWDLHLQKVVKLYEVRGLIRKTDI
jgi:hypothetical protein